MSAWLRPACGRASVWLSIFTISAGFVASGRMTPGSPVSGAGVASAVVVDGATAVVVVATELDDDVVLRRWRWRCCRPATAAAVSPRGQDEGDRSGGAISNLIRWAGIASLSQRSGERRCHGLPAAVTASRRAAMRSRAADACRRGCSATTACPDSPTWASADSIHRCAVAREAECGRPSSRVRSFSRAEINPGGIARQLHGRRCRPAPHDAG